jgi:hypothetical protein
MLGFQASGQGDGVAVPQRQVGATIAAGGLGLGAGAVGGLGKPAAL